MTAIGNILEGDEDARPFTIVSRVVGAYVDGIYAQEDGTSTAATGVIVPAKGETLMRLPEGSRSEESIQIFTQAPLKTSRDEGRQEADQVITEDGRVWKVRHVEDWFEVGAFYDVLCSTVPSDATLLPVFFGASSVDIDTALEASTLLSTVQASGHVAFEADADVGEYLYYVCPQSFGTPEFEVSGFVGGFELFFPDLNATLDVYRSVHTGLGNTQVQVRVE